MADLTHLDSGAIKTFMANDLADFISALEKIRKDDPGGVRALKSLVEGMATPETLDENQFAAIGLMGADDSVHGQTLIKVITSVAESVDGELAAHHTLFKDMDRDLQETVDTLLKTQGNNLSEIGAEEFLDIFTDVDDDLAAGGKSASTHDKS
ncbi:type VII secretion system-associated protein [Streptomyces sp. NBC_01341]|uniref:type VII secretion system-associated protein n=1 Tax=Streptomyces sp. NBC_01341 TaxID=2903831 RepID=UPI002E1213EC|nr:type VII secretion system-associated protein [Streptomyces sp. NBC_01341]